MGKVVIYPGSFDPVTYGHLDVLKRATHIFGQVIIAVANNTSKKYLFTLQERVELLEEATDGMPGVKVESFDGLVIDYARQKKTNVLIRGLRMTSDFEYEFQIALTNRRLAEDIETIFLMPSERHSFLSSSLLKEVSKFNADISSFVPRCVEDRLKVKLAA
ncbi:MAG: pantetheine-phosphate adenylyltransferase [Candidatus Omnitrophota bacterium]